MSINIERIEGQIDLITINRPEALNAINNAVMQGLHDYFVGGGCTADTYGVIITGSGPKAFVAGADITQFKNVTPERAIELAKFGHDVFDAIDRFHIPVVAAVNGFALGGGCELAMACHLRIASENALFGQPEVNLGIIPGYGGTQRLVQLIGKTKAMELLLTGDNIAAQDALALGLVNKVTSSEELITAAKDMLAKILKKGPNAVKRVIELLYDSNRNDKFYQEEYSSFGTLMVDEECQEGVTAFLEKRKPDFRK